MNNVELFIDHFMFSSFFPLVLYDVFKLYDMPASLTSSITAHTVNETKPAAVNVEHQQMSVYTLCLTSMILDF